MSSNPLVYVIVLNYNRRGDTLECIRSLYRMDYPDFRVMLVDNGSTDGTAEAVREAFPDVDILVNERNLMYAGGNNAGMARAMKHGADCVLLINNDTVVEPRLLTELVDAMQAHPGAGIAGPLIYYHRPGHEGPELIWYAGGIVELWQGLTAHRGIRTPDTGEYKEAEETGYVTGCCMLLTRECLETVGLLDTAYTLYSEDADFCMRARLAGFRLLFVPRARMWHKVSVSSGGEFSCMKLKRKLRANLRFFIRYAKPWHWLTMPFFFIGRTLWHLFTRAAAHKKP